MQFSVYGVFNEVFVQSYENVLKAVLKMYETNGYVILTQLLVSWSPTVTTNSADPVS